MLEIEVYNNITDKAINSLSKLQKLRSIKIQSNEILIVESIDWFVMPFITDSGLIGLINNCPQINWIEFNCKPNISRQTIDALIALALRKPRIQFKHCFRRIHQNYNQCKYKNDSSIDLNSFQFPYNLFIINK